MDVNVERNIIRTFIAKSKRERADHMLSNKDVARRQHFIWRLEQCIDQDQTIVLPNRVSCCSDVLEMLSKYTSDQKCYIISLDKDIDGKTMGLLSALEHIVFNGPALLYSNSTGIAYFEGEPAMRGATTRWILKG